LEWTFENYSIPKPKIVIRFSNIKKPKNPRPTNA